MLSFRTIPMRKYRFREFSCIISIIRVENIGICEFIRQISTKRKFDRCKISAVLTGLHQWKEISGGKPDGRKTQTWEYGIIGKSAEVGKENGAEHEVKK